MQKNIEQIKQEKREAVTFIFKDKNGGLLPTYPLFSLLNFSQDKKSHTYMSMNNTCQINSLSKDLDNNPFLGCFCGKFMEFDAKNEINNLLIQKTKDNKFGNNFAINTESEGNLLSVIKLFNFENEVNQNIDLSCGGFKSFDVVDVTCDDYLTKYFETLGESPAYKHMLYHKNLNISSQNGRNVKLATGLTNFCGETLRKMLLDKGYYLSVDGKIYKIQDDVGKFELVKLLLLNTVRDVLYGEMNAFKIDDSFMEIFGEKANNLLKSVFDDLGISEEIKFEYKQKNIRYNSKNKRFEMEIDGRSYDATGWIYTKIEQILIDNNAEGKYFFGNKPNAQNAKPLDDNLYNQIMNETTKVHSTELLKLIENTAKVFDYELKNAVSNVIEFPDEDLQKLGGAFYDKTPIEFFFRDPLEIAKLNEGDQDESHSKVVKYVLQHKVTSMLTEDGQDFLEKIKSYLLEQNLISQGLDDSFDKYTDDDNMKLGNPINMSKIEFSFIASLIECFQCGNGAAYDHFPEYLNGYLNYFFYNYNSSKQQSDKTYEELQKRYEYLCGEIQKQRQKQKLKKQKNEQELQELQTERQELAKKFVKLEIDKDIEKDISKFKHAFIGFDEGIIDEVVRSEIEQFSKDNDLFWEADKMNVVFSEFKMYLTNQNTKKIDYKLFRLYLNYYLQVKKIEDTRYMDGVEQDDGNEDMNAKLNFKIVGTLIEYKKEYEMESEVGTLLDNFQNNKKIMDVFHLLEFFIYAAYMAAGECNAKIKAEVASNASDLQLFIYTNPNKLVKLICDKNLGVADTLISFLLKNTELKDNEEVIKACKTNICRFMERTANVDHMTQLSLVKFDAVNNNNNRKYKNLIMYKNNGMLDFCLAPLQTIDKINGSNISQRLFNADIKLVDHDKNCDLILNPDIKNSELKQVTDAEALNYFCVDFERLIKYSIEHLKENSYLFWLCLRKKPELLLYNDKNGKDSNILFKLLKILTSDNNFDNINNKYMPVIYVLLDMKEQKMSLASVSHLLKCVKVCSKAYLKQEKKFDPINFIELAFKAIEKMYFDVEYFPADYNQVINLYKDILDSLNSLLIDELITRTKKLDDLLPPEQQKKLVKYLYVLHEKVSTDDKYKQWIQNKEYQSDLIGNDPIVNDEDVKMGDFVKYLMENKFSRVVSIFDIDKLELPEDILEKLKITKALFEHFGNIKINPGSKELKDRNAEHMKAFFESLKSLNEQDYEEQMEIFLSLNSPEGNIIQKLCLTVDDIDLNAKSLAFFVDFISNRPEMELGFCVQKSLLHAICQGIEIINNNVNSPNKSNKTLLEMLKNNTNVTAALAIKLIKRIYPKIKKKDELGLTIGKECLQVFKWLNKIPDGANKLQDLLLSDDLGGNVIRKLCLTVDDIDLNAKSLAFFVDFISNHPEIKLSFSVAERLLHIICRAYEIVNSENHQFRDHKILLKVVRDNANATFDFAMKLVGRISVQLNNTNRLTLAGEDEEGDYFQNMLRNLNYIIQYQNNNDIKEEICQDYKDLMLWLYLLYKKVYGNNRGFYENASDSIELNDNEVVLSEYKISDSIEKNKEKNVFWRNCKIDDFIRNLNCMDSRSLFDIAKLLLNKADVKKQYLIYKLVSIGDISAFSELVNDYPDELNELLQAKTNWLCIYKLFFTVMNGVPNLKPGAIGSLLDPMSKLMDNPGINMWAGEFQHYVHSVKCIMMNNNDFSSPSDDCKTYLTNVLKAIDKVCFSDIDVEFERWKNADSLKRFFSDFSEIIGYMGLYKISYEENKSLILKLYVLYKRCLHDKDYYEAHKNEQDFTERAKNRPKLLKEYSVGESVDEIKAKDVFYEDNCIGEFEKYLTDNNFMNISQLVGNLPERQKEEKERKQKEEKERKQKEEKERKEKEEKERKQKEEKERKEKEEKERKEKEEKDKKEKEEKERKEKEEKERKEKEERERRERQKRERRERKKRERRERQKRERRERKKRERRERERRERKETERRQQN